SGDRNYPRVLRPDPARTAGGSGGRSGISGTLAAGSRTAVPARIPGLDPTKVERVGARFTARLRAYGVAGDCDWRVLAHGAVAGNRPQAGGVARFSVPVAHGCVRSCGRDRRPRPECPGTGRDVPEMQAMEG